MAYVLRLLHSLTTTSAQKCLYVETAVDLKFMSPAIGSQALIGRSVDIITAGGEFIQAGLNTEKVIYIAGIANRVVLSLYGKPELRSLSDLRDLQSRNKSANVGD